MSARKTLLVIMPAYNEATNLGSVLGPLLARRTAADVIVVDDGSTDDTARTARELGARVISHGANRGYGAALVRDIATRWLRAITSSFSSTPTVSTIRCKLTDCLVRSRAAMQMSWSVRAWFVAAATRHPYRGSWGSGCLPGWDAG